MATIDTRYLTVLKDYSPESGGGTPYERIVQRYENEVFAYTELSWATPKLDGHNPLWLEAERLTPLTDIPPQYSVKYRQPLRALLQRLHDSGWWHRDVSVDNVVIHPVRGPLLIDWEWLTPATSNVSYDLYGAKIAQSDNPFPIEGDDTEEGAHWWSGSRAPGHWWRGL